MSDYLTLAYDAYATLGSEASIRARMSPLAGALLAADLAGAEAALVGAGVGLADAALDAALDIAEEVAADLLREAAELVPELVAAVGGVIDAIPVISAAWSVMDGIADIVRAAHAAEQAAWRELNAAQTEEYGRQCMAYQASLQPLGGTPADLFVRRVRSGLNTDGSARWESGADRNNPSGIPLIGRVAVELFEHRWTFKEFDALVRVAGGWERPPDDVWWEVMGIRRAAAEQMGTARIWPVLEDAERWALEQTHRALLAIGRQPLHTGDAGDEGRGLWAQYLDLLYSIGFRDRWPLGRPASSTRPAPPFPARLWPKTLGWQQVKLVSPDSVTAAHLRPQAPTLREEAPDGPYPAAPSWQQGHATYEEMPQCHGDPGKAGQALAEWTHAWGQRAYPPDLAKADAQRKALGAALSGLATIRPVTKDAWATRGAPGPATIALVRAARAARGSAAGRFKMLAKMLAKTQTTRDKVLGMAVHNRSGSAGGTGILVFLALGLLYARRRRR